MKTAYILPTWVKQKQEVDKHERQDLRLFAFMPTLARAPASKYLGSSAGGRETRGLKTQRYTFNNQL